MTGLSLLLLAGLALAADAPGDDNSAARKTVEAFVKKAGGQRGVVQIIKDDALAEMFPKHQFATVLFRPYPVTIAPPKGWKSSNIVVVPDTGDLVLVTNSDNLKTFFAANLPSIKDEATAKLLAKAWLRLSYEFSQDGFFKFTIADKDIQLRDDNGVKVVSGRVLVDPTGGNKGEISASLTIREQKLDQVEEKRKVIAGIRPRCQATKLLDPDPVVRVIAEDSLRVLGRAAKPYLDEQRAQASPEMQQAIDRVWRKILEEDR